MKTGDDAACSCSGGGVMPVVVGGVMLGPPDAALARLAGDGGVQGHSEAAKHAGGVALVLTKKSTIRLPRRSHASN